MAKKLKDDQIRWILSLSLDAKGVQGELHTLSSSVQKLTSDNKTLREEMKAAEKYMNEAEKAMKKLEEAGKTTGKEYQRAKVSFEENEASLKELKSQIDKNNRSIAELNQKSKEIVSTMKLEDMTMNQLRSRAASLRTQLNNTSKAADPKVYAQLEKELKDTEKQMTTLSTRTKNLCDTLNTMKGVLLANIVTDIGNKIKGWAKAAIEFTKEGIRMAASVQGIQQAFNRFASAEDLNRLRESTGGLVNDMELMKAAVRAQHFNIPLNQLGKLLAFAQQRARDTGQSVDYMVNSIVDGIGRKSTRLIDNLGISTVRLNEEIKKGGDFASAVGKIVDEEMGKVGESIDTAAETATRKAVALENLQLKWGQVFVGLSTRWNKFTTGFITGITDLLTKTVSTKRALEDFNKEAAQQSRELNSVFSAYKKANEGTAEKDRLLKIIKEKYGTYIQDLIDEKGRITDVDEAQKRVNISLRESIALKIKNKTVDQLNTKLINDQVKTYQNLRESSQGIGDDNVNILINEIANAFNSAKTTKELGNAYNKMLEKAQNYGIKLTEKRKVTIGSGASAFSQELESNSDFLNYLNILVDQTSRINSEIAKTEKAFKPIINGFTEIEKIVNQDTPPGGNNSPEGKTSEQLKKERFDKELADLDHQLKKKLLLEQNNYIERIEIEDEFGIKRKMSLADFEKISKEALDKNLQAKLDLTKKYGYDTLYAEKAIADNTIKNQQQADKILLDSIKKSREGSLNALKSSQDLEKIELDRKLKNGTISQTKYNDEILALNTKYAGFRLKVEQIYAKAVEELRQNDVDGAADAVEKAIEEIKKLALELGIATRSQTEDTKGILGELQEYFSELKFDGPAEQLRMAFENTFDELNKLRKKDEANFADYAAAIGGALGGMMNAVAAYSKQAFEFETNALEAEKQKQLAIAGENADARQAIEQEYAQKELDLKKDQADAQAGIESAQLWITTATGIAAAWATAIRDLGPIIGPIMAGTLTAALLATAGVQQAMILKNRDAIKNTTLQSNGGSSSSAPPPVTGQRVVKPQSQGFAEGGLHIDGGYTGDGDRYEVAGRFPDGDEYHRQEYIIATPELRQPEGLRMARALERMRLKRTRKNAVPGFADGGLHSTNIGKNSNNIDAAAIGSNGRVMSRILAVLERLEQNGVQASVGLTDLETQQLRKSKSNNIFKRSDN